MTRENGKNTQFISTGSINIGYAELMDMVSFKFETSYLDEKNNAFPSNAIYTYTKLNKENLVEILGEDGYINIKDESGNTVATLSKENTEVKYEKEQTNLTFETSKPIETGILEIENGREIKPLEYSKAQMDLFKSYKIELNTNVIKDNKEIISGKVEKTLSLQNPEIKAELIIDDKNISTVTENEDVEIRVVLKTNDMSSALYKNPKMEIVLPKSIESINVDSVKLLYEKELKFKDAKIYKNADGNLVIGIELQGEQTTYNETAIAEGATIVMNADITASKTATTKLENVVLNIENEKGTKTFEGKMQIVAPTGVIAVNEMTNFNDKNEEVVSIMGKTEVGQIDMNNKAQTAKVNMTVVNNYDYDIENAVILGRTTFEGNKSIKTGEDLGSTFTAKVTKKIESENVPNENMKVYYSANGEANKSLEDTNNNWRENANEVPEIRSYMIVLDNYKLGAGDKASFNYNVEIPQNLGYNEGVYQSFATYYSNQSEEVQNYSLYENSTESTVGAITETVPELTLELTADASTNVNVEERTIVNYNLKVKNVSENSKVSNLTAKITIPEKAFYIENGTRKDIREVILPIDEIPAGGETNVQFKLSMKSYTEVPTETITIKTRDDFTSEIEWNHYQERIPEIEAMIKQQQEANDVKVVAGIVGYEDRYKTEITNKIVKEDRLSKDKTKLKVETNTSDENILLKEGTVFQYFLNIKNNTDNKIVKATCTLPSTLRLNDEEGKYVENYTPISDKGKIENGVITWDLTDIDTFQKTLVIDVIVNSLPEGKYDEDVNMAFTVYYEDGTTKTSEPLTYKVSKQGGAKVEQTVNKTSFKAGEEVIFTVTIKNLSTSSISAVITENLPSALEFETNNTQNQIETVIAGNSTYVATIKTLAKKVPQDTKLKNNVTVKFRNSTVPQVTSESDEITILGTGIGGNQGGDPITPTPDENVKYKIAGTAWLDENKDGKRDASEKLLSDIKVYLLESSTNKIVKETKTSDTGSYSFTDIEKGNYIVAFEYDTKAYDITKYQAKDITDNINSDAIEMKIKINDTLTKLGATNIIRLEEDALNIDLGLIDNPKFDLELTKGISLVQVSTGGNTKTYEFKNTDLAKIEIKEKEMAGALVAITYTFKVKNTGAVSGYVNKVADYKAKDLEFSSTLNPEWYQDESGALYNTTLSDTEIKPGEEKELSLILTKTMTTENTGLSNNIAEIAECSNENGLTDIDSTPGNKNSEEDDYGKADIIIAVKTGGILVYGGIMLAVLAIFAFGAYEINKRVLRKI